MPSSTVAMGAIAALLVGPACAFFQPAALGVPRPSLRASAERPARAASVRPSALGLRARFAGEHYFDDGRAELSRKDMMLLSVVGVATLLAPARAAPEDLDTRPVVVFGAGGYTGGDVVRSLVKKGRTVIAVTRRPVKVVARGGKVGADTLVLDDIKDEARVRPVTADVLRPETLAGIMEGAGAVIFCAASRPAVKVTVTPGTQPGGNRDMTGANMMSYMETRMAVQPKGGYIEDAKGGKIAPPSDHVEDIGLANVAKTALALQVPRLVIVSSVCAKCQKKAGAPEYDAGDMVDKGAASCDACYKKQDGENAVRDMYVGAPKGVGYTIVRPGMLSPGEERGVKDVELNQGVTKSGIISRLDLAEVLVAAASTDNGLGKTFEVYYRDTAQPVDMYASLKSCKELGKSVKECFFGEGYDESTPVSLDEVMKSPLKGTLFASGSEVQGNSYTDMLNRLQPDNQKSFDLSSLAADNVM